jgi:hypothetical protein
MARTAPFHYQIAALTMELLKQGRHRNTTYEKYHNGTIEIGAHTEQAFQTNSEIFISSADIYNDLSLAAIKLVIRIQQELKMNNPLWECPDKTESRIRGALSELTKKEIVYPLAGTDIYIINPLKIRKGKPLSVYGALYEYSKSKYLKDKNWRPTTSDIKRLLFNGIAEIPHEVEIEIGLQ